MLIYIKQQQSEKIGHASWLHDNSIGIKKDGQTNQVYIIYIC